MDTIDGGVACCAIGQWQNIHCIDKWSIICLWLIIENIAVTYGQPRPTIENKRKKHFQYCSEINKYTSFKETKDIQLR